jgi:hypothetical protein
VIVGRSPFRSPFGACTGLGVQNGAEGYSERSDSEQELVFWRHRGWICTLASWRHGFAATSL